MKVTMGNTGLRPWSSENMGFSALWVSTKVHNFQLSIFHSNGSKPVILISNPVRKKIEEKKFLLLIGSIPVLQTQFWPELSL